MIIDNFELIKQLLSFNSSDDFYFLQIIMRKKENPSVGSNSYILKEYYIESLTHLDSKKEEIVKLCLDFNARAYINLTSRSFKKLAFKNLEKISNLFLNDNYKDIRRSYSSVCGEFGYGEKRWIIDIDDINFNNVLYVAEEINKIKQSAFDPNVIAYIPTLNGWHIITHPFNLKLLEPLMCEKKFDIHKNNPTLLYYGNI